MSARRNKVVEAIEAWLALSEDEREKVRAAWCGWRSGPFRTALALLRAAAEPEAKATFTKQCTRCAAIAAWERHTQFSGTHPFCDEHARMERDFRQEDEQDTFYWAAVPR